MIETDICIVGAGPGGAGTALKLSYLGIPCVLIDKATFPRDKICGDAISGKVTTLLNRLDPQILNRFHGMKQEQIDVWGIKFAAPNGRDIDVPFSMNFNKEVDTAPGYVSKRIDFDNFLIEEVKRRDNIDFRDNTAIKDYEKTDDGWMVTDKTGDFKVKCKLLVQAGGAYNPFSRHNAGLEKDDKHYAAAVRAYYTGVEQMHEDNFIELHFVKEITPGYFWIFPLPNGGANVGLGMRSDFVSKQKINLKEAMLDIIENNPKFKNRFANAKLENKIVGYGLPLGSKKRPISGENYVLVGDAGHLIDPLTGEGIGNAIYSGFIAAELAEKCIAEQRFDAEYLKAYDVRVARVLYSEMRLSYQLQRTLRYPWLANTLANLVARNRKFIDLISEMYTDFALRKQLINPIFWFKLLSGRKVS